MARKPKPNTTLTLAASNGVATSGKSSREAGSGRATSGGTSAGISGGTSGGTSGGGAVLSQTSEYALRAMTFLAEPGRSAMTSQAISDATQVPKHYLSKVLRMLVLAELVTATRGPTGGFVLNRDRPPITVLDVVNAVDPIQRITECPLGRPDHIELCPLHRMMNQTIDQVILSMEKVRIEQLCESFVPEDQPRPRTRRAKRDTPKSI